jgi:hypothetical protein
VRFFCVWILQRVLELWMCVAMQGLHVPEPVLADKSMSRAGSSMRSDMKKATRAEPGGFGM